MAKKICLKCNTENDERAKFCMACGAELPEEVTEVTEVTEKETEPEIVEAIIEPVGKKKKKRPIKKIILGIVIAIIAFIAYCVISAPNIESISVSYDGDKEAGVVLDENNDGFTVIGRDSEGHTYELSGWKIETPQTLNMDETAIVTVKYNNFSEDVEVTCSTSELVELEIDYSGDTSAGVVLDENNDGFIVTGVYKNGTKETLGGWTIKEPATLQEDSEAKVNITYENLSYDVTIKGSTSSIVKLSAKYSGSKKAGTTIDAESTDVVVTAEYKNGQTEEVTGWTVEKPVTLAEGKTSKLKIKYGGEDCVLKIECSDMNKKQYKEKCKTYSYDKIARDPDDYEDKYAKFSGKVLQVLEDTDSQLTAMRIATDGGYNDVLYVYYYRPEGSSRILEDDRVTVYGTLGGLYSYEATSGATITIPLMYGKYVE